MFEPKHVLCQRWLAVGGLDVHAPVIDGSHVFAFPIGSTPCPHPSWIDDTYPSLKCPPLSPHSDTFLRTHSSHFPRSVVDHLDA